ncbi:MAG: BPSS1780 family membrane protein [Candidatus Thiodiazotropha sp.]
MSADYQVIYSGKLQPSANQARLVALFDEKFKLGQEKAQRLISSGRPVTLKKDLDLDKAVKYKEALEKLGMVIHIDPDPELFAGDPADLTVDIYSGGDDETTEVLDQSQIHRERCPKCGSGNMQLGICQDCGIVAAKFLAAQAAGRVAESASDEELKDEELKDDPYTPPEADLEEAHEGELVGPRAVSMGRAFRWLADGWAFFKDSPLSWIFALLLWGVVNVLVAKVPFIGVIIIILLSPTLLAGFMIGCREQEEGEPFRVSYLFAGFRQNVGQTILIGLFYLILAMLIVFGMMFALFGSMANVLTQGGELDTMSLMAVTSPMIVSFVLGMTAFTMLLMAFIFAPALAALNDLSAWQSMKMSFMGCLKNLLPLTLYSILVTVLFVLNSLFMLLSPISVVLSDVLLGLGMLILFPVQIGAIYTAYTDIYYN